ncbi:hypothetical protein T492DRAFT_864085 [Pavlovales sp. CCMP2436]|nr:hypothetical protein T492DRAFT_864085 [Pavlovales sp. CCMP2436]
MRSGSEGPAHPAGAGGSGSGPVGEDVSTADESEGQESEDEGEESGEERDDGQSADVSERDGHDEQLPAAVDTRSGAQLGDGQVGPSAVRNLAERVVAVAGVEAGPSALPTPIQPTAPAATVLPAARPRGKSAYDLYKLDARAKALSGAAPEEKVLKAAWAELNDAGKVVWTAAAKVSATMAKAERERLDLLEAAAEPGSAVALAFKPREVSRSKKAVANAALLNARLAHLADRDLWRSTALSYARRQGSVHLKGVAAVEQICVGLELLSCAMHDTALVIHQTMPYTRVGQSTMLRLVSAAPSVLSRRVADSLNGPPTHTQRSAVWVWSHTQRIGTGLPHAVRHHCLAAEQLRVVELDELPVGRQLTGGQSRGGGEHEYDELGQRGRHYERARASQQKLTSQ